MFWGCSHTSTVVAVAAKQIYSHWKQPKKERKERDISIRIYSGKDSFSSSQSSTFPCSNSSCRREWWEWCWLFCDSFAPPLRLIAGLQLEHHHQKHQQTTLWLFTSWWWSVTRRYWWLPGRSGKYRGHSGSRQICQECPLSWTHLCEHLSSYQKRKRRSPLNCCSLRGTIWGIYDLQRVSSAAAAKRGRQKSATHSVIVHRYLHTQMTHSRLICVHCAPSTSNRRSAISEASEQLKMGSELMAVVADLLLTPALHCWWHWCAGLKAEEL